MTLRAIRPMMAVSAAALPIGDDWSYEVKWDGYRAQAMKRGAVVPLASRNLKDFTSQFPAIVELKPSHSGSRIPSIRFLAANSKRSRAKNTVVNSESASSTKKAGSVRFH
jgi:hypothetical protein